MTRLVWWMWSDGQVTASCDGRTTDYEVWILETTDYEVWIIERFYS